MGTTEREEEKEPTVEDTADDLEAIAILLPKRVYPGSIDPRIRQPTTDRRIKRPQ